MNKLFQRMTPHAPGQRDWGGGGLDITPNKNNEQPIPVAAWISGRPLLELRVRIPSWAWLSVSCACCVLQVELSAKGRSLVQRSPTESVCVSPCVCDQMRH